MFLNIRKLVYAIKILILFLCWKMTDKIIRVKVQFWVPKLSKDVIFIGPWFEMDKIVCFSTNKNC